MTLALTITVAMLYAVAVGLYARLARGGDPDSKAPLLSLVGACVTQVLVSTIIAVTGENPLSFATFLRIDSAAPIIGLAFVLASTRSNKYALLGAFVSPIALILYLMGRAPGLGELHPTEHRAALFIHVGASIVGLAAFGLACAAAAAYLVQENRLRSKQLGQEPWRLPPLAKLDELGVTLVGIGFPLLTLGIAMGSFATNGRIASWSLPRLLGLVAWGFFAAVLALRLAAGWRGRRTAIGTMIGFGCAVLVLLGYALRSAPGAAL